MFPVYGPVPVLKSVALMTKLNVPPAVGTPADAAAACDRPLTPGGSEPETKLKEYGAMPPFYAVKWLCVCSADLVH